MFSSKQGFDLDVWLPHLIRLTCYAGGNRKIYDQFIDSLKKNSRLNISIYSLFCLDRDLKEFIECFGEIEHLSVVNHKKYFFRPINIYLDELYIALNRVGNINSYAKIKLLFKCGIINSEQQDILINNLNDVLYLRLQQHFKFNEQKISISRSDPYFPHFIKSQASMNSLLVNLKENLLEKESSLLRKEALLAKAYHLRMFKNYYEKKPLQLPLENKAELIRRHDL